MKSGRAEIEFAIEVFMRGFSAGLSRTFPYMVSQAGPLFELTEHTRESVDAYLRAKGRHASGFLFRAGEGLLRI